MWRLQRQSDLTHSLKIGVLVLGSGDDPACLHRFAESTTQIHVKLSANEISQLSASGALGSSLWTFQSKTYALSHIQFWRFPAHSYICAGLQDLRYSRSWALPLCTSTMYPHSASQRSERKTFSLLQMPSKYAHSQLRKSSPCPAPLLAMQWEQEESRKD